MRFGKLLKQRQTPEWRSKYLDYDLMKNMLKKTTRLRERENAKAADDNDQLFFQFCDEELKKIELFYKSKVSEAESMFKTLKRDYCKEFVGPMKHMVQSLKDSMPTFKRKKVKPAENLDPEQILQDEEDEENRRRQKKMWYNREFYWTEFYLSLVLLQNYQQLNHEGFRKIMKKRDKLLHDSKGGDWYREKPDQADFYKDTSLKSLINETETIFIDLNHGDRSTAMQRLRVCPLNEKQEPWLTFGLGFFIGSTAIMLLVICLTLVFQPRPAYQYWTGVRFFRGWFIFFFNIILVSINVYGWQTGGVNHVLIFQIDPRDHLTYQGLMEIGAMLCFFWALCVLGYLYAGAMGISELVFPLILNALVLIWLFNPTNFGTRNSRSWFLKQMARCFFPIKQIKFTDFWLMDQFNSLVIFLLDLEYTVCFYAVQVDYRNGTNMQMLQFSNATAPFGVDYVTGEDICRSDVYLIRPILSFVPAFIRLLQCLRRIPGSDHWSRHLANAGKYSTVAFVIICRTLGARYSDMTQPMGKMMLVLSTLAFTASYIYALYWDLFMDWGLMKKKYRYLRAELIYQKRPYYWLAMLENSLMRLAWMMNVCLAIAWEVVATDVLLFITSMLELFRRFVWNFFRLENEHLNNCGDFRAVRDISIKPIDPEKDLGKDKKEGGKEQKKLSASETNTAQINDYDRIKAMKCVRMDSAGLEKALDDSDEEYLDDEDSLEHNKRDNCSDGTVVLRDDNDNDQWSQEDDREKNDASTGFLKIGEKHASEKESTEDHVVENHKHDSELKGS